MKRCSWGLLMAFAFASLLLQVAEGRQSLPTAGAKRPNVVLVLVDDMSLPHFSAYNPDLPIQTPGFDRIAREGMLAMNAYSPDASCTPTRNAILTGRNPYELGGGSVLHNALPASIATYQEILAQHGYRVGFTGKGAGPTFQLAAGRLADPAGPRYARHVIRDAPEGISTINYAANLGYFMDGLQPDQPFSFWIGINEPHVPYSPGIGARSGLPCDSIEIPAFMYPDATAKEWMCDYFYEILWLDGQLEAIYDVLASRGQLDNTILVVTSDNGLAHPYAKMTLYDYGTHMPLAVRWGNAMPGGRVVTDFVSMQDFAPTFLEAAGVPVPDDMTARSFLPTLRSAASGRVDPARDHCFTAHERHDVGVEGREGKPMRAIETDHYTYIYNYPQYMRYDTATMPSGLYTFSFDTACILAIGGWSPECLIVDSVYEYTPDVPLPVAPATILRWGRNHGPIKRLFHRIYLDRTEEELFLKDGSDPYQFRNLAYHSHYRAIADSLRTVLLSYNKETNDPRRRPEPYSNGQYQLYDWLWRLFNADSVDLQNENMRLYGRGNFVVEPPGAGPSAVQAGPNLGLRRGYYTGQLTWKVPAKQADVVYYAVGEMDRHGAVAWRQQTYAGNSGMAVRGLAVASGRLAVASRNARGYSVVPSTIALPPAPLGLPDSLVVRGLSPSVPADAVCTIQNLTAQRFVLDSVSYPAWMSGPAGPVPIGASRKFSLRVSVTLPSLGEHRGYIRLYAGQASDSVLVVASTAAMPQEAPAKSMRLPDQKTETPLQVFPNPSRSGLLQVQKSWAQPTASSVACYNLLGVCVARLDCPPAHQLDAQLALPQNLPNGLYMVRVLSADGQTAQVPIRLER